MYSNTQSNLQDTRINVWAHAWYSTSTHEPTHRYASNWCTDSPVMQVTGVQAHRYASNWCIVTTHRYAHRYASNWTNVSRALPARQARERHTYKSGTHASGKYYCLHTRVWPTSTVTVDTVLNTASKSFCCFIWRRCSCVGINPK